MNRSNQTSKNDANSNAKQATLDSVVQKEADSAPRNGIHHKMKHVFLRTSQSRKKIFWGLILVISWRTLYFLDLDKFTNSEVDTTYNRISSVPLDLRRRSVAEELTSMNLITDDMLLPSTLSKTPLLDFQSPARGTNLRGSNKYVLTVNDIDRMSTGMHLTSGRDGDQLLPQQMTVLSSESEKFGVDNDNYGNSNHRDASLRAAVKYFLPLNGGNKNNQSQPKSVEQLPE